MSKEMATSLTHFTLFCKSSFFFHKHGFRTFPFSAPFSSSSSSLSADNLHRQKWRQPVVSVLEIGGIKIDKDDVVRDDPTNNVPDTIFSKLGMQLHRMDHHPIGILKNTIFDYFDTNYLRKFDKFDDLCPIVSVKELYFLQNFDDVLVPADHVSRSYNDTYYIDSQTVLRCHTSAHQAELLRRGHTHFLVTGDVYRRDSIDSTHYPVFHQMEGVRVFSPNEWQASGMDATSYAAEDLKKCLEGLARHLFGKLGLTFNQYLLKFTGGVEMRWVDTYFPFTNPSFELEIYFQDGVKLINKCPIWFQEKWLEVLGCGVTEQEILKRSGKTDNVAWAFGLGLERLAMVLFEIPDIRLFWSTDERFTSQVFSYIYFLLLLLFCVLCAPNDLELLAHSFPKANLESSSSHFQRYSNVKDCPNCPKEVKIAMKELLLGRIIEKREKEKWEAEFNESLMEPPYGDDMVHVGDSDDDGVQYPSDCETEQ
ncbi:hypothetical protein HHK36_004657 [Tetracentron sinense]|uniref:phenylalanine--tRNA ligase n=1 Tax=Tetracentron sinense TaxID=13715 RepID=A0A834ZJV5_TETSI|nr:hypothetical protein HHK36_004657 [Tetracentron sinense]